MNPYASATSLDSQRMALEDWQANSVQQDLFVARDTEGHGLESKLRNAKKRNFAKYARIQ